MPDIADPVPQTSAEKAENPAPALAARVAAFQREQVVVDYANRGVSVPEIAARLGVPEIVARRKLRAALVRMLPATPEDFAALQVSRLNEALLVAFSAMETMGLKAVDRVLRILRALERQHTAARPLLSIEADAGAGEPARPAPSPAPDATVPRERNPIAAQPFEKAQNRSQTPASSADRLPLAAQPAGGEGPSARGVEGRPPLDGLRGRGRAPDGREIRPSPSQPLEKAQFTPGRAASPAQPDRRFAGSPVALDAVASQLLAAVGLGVPARAPMAARAS